MPIEVVEHETERVVEIIDPDGRHPNWRLDRADAGLNINLNHEKYYTRVIYSDTSQENNDG